MNETRRATSAGRRRIRSVVGCGMSLVLAITGIVWADGGLDGGLDDGLDGGFQWSFDHANDVRGVSHIEPGRPASGVLAGQTTWDPIVGLRVPPEGIDAARYTWLTVRMYSSAKADVLDIYYQSPDGNWCLGGKLPIVQGWATYRMDLTRNAWRETRSSDSDAARQWGGPSKRVSMLRIDPGNQADRWIALDSVRLEQAGAGLEEGVTPEPRGKGKWKSLQVSRSIHAGGILRVSGELTVEDAANLDSCTLFTQLRRGHVVLRLHEQKVSIADGVATWVSELPISAYWYEGTAEVEVGCYEVDVTAGEVPNPLEIQITNDRVGQVRPPKAELRKLGGDPALYVNGQPYPAEAYVTDGNLYPEYHREMAQAGVHLYCDWFGASVVSDLGHIAPDRYDYSEYDRYFAGILDVDPDAMFVPHIGITGARWWQEQHPDEMCRFADGTRGPTSFASELWRRDAGEDLRRLIAYLRRAPYADRIVGYAFFNGYTAEWQMWGTWQDSRDDYSAPALRAFRQFLRTRYETDERLQQAWNDPQVTFDTAAMPDATARRPEGLQVLRDPARERPAIDFYEFISNMDADALLYFAHVVREATAGESLVGTYYGYLTAHGINQQDSGHLAARRVFDSPDIDFLMSPPNYWYRKPGEACTFMSATDSFRLRGKLWWDESDHRTHLTDLSAGYGRAENLQESLGVYWRELAEVVTKRAAVSWFDMSGGWFSDPGILAALGQGHVVMRDSLKHRAPFVAEIGVFIDPRSYYWMRPSDVNAALSLYQVTTMPQSGAPWDFLLLDDMDAAWMPDYKLYVFLNAFHVPPEMRAKIHHKLKRNGATALFVYAAGLLSDSGESLEGMQALTGMTVVKQDRPGHPQVRFIAEDPLSKGLASDAVVGYGRAMVAPMFQVADPEARVVARLIDDGSPGIAVKTLDGWTSVYSAAMQLPPSVVRNLSRSAGVHVWLETDDALYTDGQFVGVHAATDGEKVIHLPGRFQVTERISGRVVADDASEVTIPMRRAETVLLELRPREPGGDAG